MAKAAKVEKEANNAPLKREYETYLAHLPQLAQHEGKFVLIHGSDVAGVYDTYKDALTAGYEKFGLKQFLVKRVASVEKPVIAR